jgi:hypothetical protein
MVHSMMNRVPGDDNDSAQRGFVAALMLGIGTAIAWTVGRGSQK